MTLIDSSKAFDLANKMREASLNFFDIKEWRIEADRKFAIQPVVLVLLTALMAVCIAKGNPSIESNSFSA
jgi:hypothetical protein